MIDDKKLGTLFGVGLGAGDPELLTLKAVRLIGAADLLVYSAPESGDSLARTIAAPYIAQGTAEYALRLPMTTARQPAQLVYDGAAAYLAPHLAAGKSVVYLCQGDPLFYGSFIYLMQRLQADFPCHIVPGVSCLTAAAAAARFPLVGRNDSLSVIPATQTDSEIARHLTLSDCIVIIKLGINLARIRQLLTQAGLLSHSLYIERATMVRERILPLAEVSLEAAPYFALILVRRKAVE